MKNSIIGKSYNRLDAFEKATGIGKYTDDFKLNGMLYGKVLRSPHANAVVKSINIKHALDIEGVITILVPEDVPQTRYNCSGNPPSKLIINDELILTNRPLYVGDRIAAVAAIDPVTCEKAINAIEIEYELFPPILSMRDAIKKEGIHPEINDSNIVSVINAKSGEVEIGFADSDFIMEETFTTPPVQNVCLEPASSICEYTHDKKFNIISTSQTPYQERRLLANLLDVPEIDVRIRKPLMGGGFGERQQLISQVIGCLLSKRTGLPVKITNTREEQMYAIACRHESEVTIKIGMKNDGTLCALKIDALYNTGAYATHGPTVVAAGARKLNYNIPHYSFEGKCIYTNTTPAGAMRGYGNPQVTFAREVLISRMCNQLGLDAEEVRMKNHIRTGDTIPSWTSPIQSCEVDEIYTHGRAIKQNIDENYQKRENGNQAEWGVAFCCHTSGPSSKEGMSSSIVNVNYDGSAILLTGSADIGQGSETILSQIVAETLGIDLSKVSISACDTRITPYDTGTFASSQTYVSGNATRRASEDALNKILTKISEVFELSPENISREGGLFVFEVGGESKAFTLEEVMKEITFNQRGGVIIGSASYRAEEAPPPFAICWARAEKDNITGSIHITDIIEAVDVGKALNPELVEAQIQGGVSMGVGYALMENIEHDNRLKKPIASDLLHYNAPLTLDMPEIYTYIAKGYEPTGPFGAKSVGELSTVPVAPAIAIAVENLTQENINDIPLNRKRIITQENLYDY